MVGRLTQMAVPAWACFMVQFETVMLPVLLPEAAPPSAKKSPAPVVEAVQPSMVTFSDPSSPWSASTSKVSRPTLSMVTAESGGAVDGDEDNAHAAGAGDGDVRRWWRWSVGLRMPDPLWSEPLRRGSRVMPSP